MGTAGAGSRHSLRRVRSFLTVLAGLLLMASIASPAMAREDAVPLCPSFFGVGTETVALIPVCTDRDLGTRDDAVRRLIVVVHGSSRNAPASLDSIGRVVRTAGLGDRTLVVAPQFLISADTWAISAEASIAYWTENGWKQGDPAVGTVGGEPLDVSSFRVVDRVIRSVSVSGSFPNLRRVVVAGHSAGGQFVNRYAAGTGTTGTLRRRGITIRYVVANPSSYLYFSPIRHTSEGFTPLSPSQRSACPSFNRYKYGTEDLNSYMARRGSQRLRSAYAAASVTYLLGELDRDPADEQLDTSCSAEWQGRHRLQRGKVYYRYLRGELVRVIDDRHQREIVAGVGHDARAMFGSSAGSAALLGR
jgi:hypothetical protein